MVSLNTLAWDEVSIHHMIPLECYGSNDMSKLIPLLRYPTATLTSCIMMMSLTGGEVIAEINVKLGCHSIDSPYSH